MNRNLKLKIVAIMAAISGTALSDCYGLQADAHQSSGGIIQAAQPYSGDHQTSSDIPIIGTPIEAPKLKLPQSSANSFGPPIVTPAQAQPKKRARMLAPISVPKEEPKAVAPAATPQTVQQASGQLPMQLPKAQHPNLPGEATAPAAYVAQATTAPTDASKDSNVVPAAQWQTQQAQQPVQLPRSRGVSSAGIPLYQGGRPSYNQSVVPPVVTGSTITPKRMAPPIISASSQVVAPVDSVMDGSASSMQSYAPAPAVMAAPTSTYAEPTYFSAPPMEAPVVSGGCVGCGGSGCNNCSTGMVSGCDSCGPNGCFDPNMVTDQYGICGSVSSARRYLNVDVLYFTRSDGDIVNSNFGGLGNFDNDIGWRVTMGYRLDATQGAEFSYLGTAPLEEFQQRVDLSGRLRTIFNSSSFFVGNETSPFFNSTLQNERKETELDSMEFNRVRWGWDVIKTFWGVRYIHVDDDYFLFSRNLANETGSFRMDARNNMIGPHIGQELFYDVGYKWSFSMFGKAGVYANFSDMKTQARKNGALFVNAEDTNVTVSGSLEAGLTAHYQLNRRARFRAGYNLLWLGNVASVSDNMPSVLSPFTGTDTGDSDDMFFHGLSVGLEFYR